MTAPKMTVARMPNFSAMRAMKMPPAPYPNQLSAIASAGTERRPPVSAAMTLSATTMIHGAPKQIERISVPITATFQDSFVSTEGTADLLGGCAFGLEGTV